MISKSKNVIAAKAKTPTTKTPTTKTPYVAEIGSMWCTKMTDSMSGFRHRTSSTARVD